MSLSNMKVFNEYFMSPTIETLDQMIEQFNAASRNAIRLSVRGFDGDFLQESMWASLATARRRVDRYASNGTVAPVDLSQIQHNTVKVAGGFGPVRFEPSQLTWLQKPTAEGVEVISRFFAESLLQDMLNTGIAAAVAAIEGQGSATTYDSGTGPISYRDLNNAHAKFGDHSNLIVANVIDGVTYHGLIDQNLANAERLFFSNGIQVVDILGRVVVVTDAPALRETGTGADAKALGLVTDGVIVNDLSDVITNIDTTNGKIRIETTWQADYAFGVGLKGYAWDVASGGKSPTDVEIATAGNWDRIATSIKHTAGVIALANV